MSTPTPPILPTTTTPTPTTLTTQTTTQSHSQPTPTPIRTSLTRLHDQIKLALTNRRPWSELTDRSAFSKPDSLTDATSRLRKNYSYFRINYLALISLTLAATLVTHPFSLLTLAAVIAAWFFLYLFKTSDQPLILFNREFSDKETLGILTVVTVFAVFLTNVASVLMSALVIGVGIVCVHGAFRVPEDLFLDDQEIVSGPSVGFLSFLSATANAAAGAATVPASRT